MNYLIVKNAGLIEPEDLYLIGSSTKRNSTDKIGMFGSGWKFALAWLLRNDCAPIIYRGQKEIKIDSTSKFHRDNLVKVITINDIETSLTTEMGMKWTGWMALREIISNAIDEGEYNLTTSWNPEINPERFDENTTTIFIPMNNDLAKVIQNYNNYFAFERTPNFENEVGRIFIKEEASESIIYRKGIKCFEGMYKSIFDVDFHDIFIDENRLTYQHKISDKFSEFVENGVPTSILRKILSDSLYFEMLPYQLNEQLKNSMIEFIDSGEKFTCPALKRLGGLLISHDATMTIPDEWFQKLSDDGLIESPFNKRKGNEPDNFIRTDMKDLNGIKYYLSPFKIDYKFHVGKFDYQKDVFIKDNNIYVKDESKLSDLKLSAIILSDTPQSVFESVLN